MPCIGSSFTISDPDSGYSGATAGTTTSQNLVDEILLILPNILAAVLIAAAGWLLATVVDCDELAGVSWI